LFLSSPENIYSDVVYGFEPTANGGAVPTVQIAPTDGYNTFFALN